MIRNVKINKTSLIKACVKIAPVRVVGTDVDKFVLETNAQQRQWLEIAGIKWEYA